MIEENREPWFALPHADEPTENSGSSLCYPNNHLLAPRILMERVIIILITITFSCQAAPPPAEHGSQPRQKALKRPAVNRVSLEFGTLDLPDTCYATQPEFYIDAYTGNITCNKGALDFSYEGGFEMPVVMKSHRKAWQQFKTETLPDSNILVYGISRVKSDTHCYASICPPTQEFGCASFILVTGDARNALLFLNIVRTFKLKPLGDILQTQTSNHAGV